MQVCFALPLMAHITSLRLTFPCFIGLKRTRDPAVLNTCDIVVDVGGVYDEKTQRFDHHQRGFEEIFGHGFTTKLSSAGLVYKCVFPRTPPVWRPHDPCPFVP